MMTIGLTSLITMKRKRIGRSINELLILLSVNGDLPQAEPTSGDAHICQGVYGRLSDSMVKLPIFTGSESERFSNDCIIGSIIQSDVNKARVGRNMLREAKEITLQKIRDEYENSKKHDLQENMPPPHLMIEKEQDLSKLNENIKTVTISEKYQEDYAKVFRAIGHFPNISGLQIYDTLPYIFLDNEDLENIERLRLVVNAVEPFVAFSLPKLKELLLFSNSQPDLLVNMDEKVYFDFSFFPALERLYISGWINLDSSCFQTLCQLESLSVKNVDMANLDWLQYVPPLKNLSLQDDSFDSVLPIVRYQPQLEKLDLFGASVTENDLQILAQMPNLQDLNLRHCPISAEQEKILRKSSITLTINNVDRMRNSFAGFANDLARETGSILYGREKNAEKEREDNNFGRLSIDAARPWEERAIELIQIRFLKMWEDMKNWDFRKEKDIMEPYRTEFCRVFLENALITYPALLLSREMAEVLYAGRKIPSPSES